MFTGKLLELMANGDNSGIEFKRDDIRLPAMRKGAQRKPCSRRRARPASGSEPNEGAE